MALSRMKLVTGLIAAGTIGVAVFIIAGPGTEPDVNLGPAEHVQHNDSAAATLTVVELFTSQACISCPPAEAFLGELIEARSDVLGLEFHVTYWDDYVDGPRGSWKDVFSDPAYTARQASYNHRIRSGYNSFTPQMVIDGQYQAVGFSRDDVIAAVDVASSSHSVEIEITGRENDTIISIGGAVAEASETDAGIWLIHFDPAQTTNVAQGENQGKTLTNHNVVRALTRVGDWSGQPVILEGIDVEAAVGAACAIIVQGNNDGRIFGAARCPDTMS
jgi:hypothetical protein